MSKPCLLILTLSLTLAALAASAAPRPGDRSVRAFSAGPGGEVAVLASEPHLPPEAFLVTADGPRQLTDTNRELLDSLSLGEVREVRFASADGTEVEAFVTLPPDHDERLTYPAILRPHGGPVSQVDFGFHFETGADPPAQGAEG